MGLICNFVELDSCLFTHLETFPEGALPPSFALILPFETMAFRLMFLLISEGGQ